MSFSLSRQTIYAILSAIEADLRTLIGNHLGWMEDVPAILGSEVFSRAVERFHKDSQTVGSQATLDELLFYIDFSDTYAILNQHRSDLPQDVASAVRESTKTLEALAPVRNRISHSRPLEIDDLSLTVDSAESLARRVDIEWSNLSSVQRRLKAEPSFVLGIQIPTSADLDSEGSKHNLPTPDFDDTGFLGRKDYVKQLIKLCSGPYPVVSIVADGGMGKTALALKTAYELIDSADCPFDAIVWTSSKTTQLTPTEIIRIDNAIQDSLGMLRSVATELGGAGAASNAVEEIVDYLREFKILLILDNLETVLDQRVRDFLSKLPEGGSKVIITSRIGVGAFEYPFRLEPMPQSESVQLLRVLAKNRGLSALVKTDNSHLAGYCNQMKHNPGFIKWFVAAVQAGQRPEDILAEPALFLQFCMSNVYRYLESQSRYVLTAMLSVPMDHTQAELSYITEIDFLVLQRALQQLLSTNMVRMISVPIGSSFESRYALGDLARDYLQKHHPASIEDMKILMGRKRQMVVAGEQMKADRFSNPYSIYSIVMRSSSDLVVAKYLRDALNLAKENRAEEALDLVAQAKSLSPDYFEVHRIEAWVAFKSGNYVLAQSAYEASLELEPESPHVHFWYGGFLLRYMNAVDDALAQFEKAWALDQKSSQVALEVARCQMYAGRYDKAENVLNSLATLKDSPAIARKQHDLHIQLYTRRADQLLAQKDYRGAFDAMVSMREVFQQIPSAEIDLRIRQRLAKTMPTIHSCKHFLGDSELRDDLESLESWLSVIANQAIDAALLKPPSPSSKLSGKVCKLNSQRAFAFIEMENGDSFFFHRKALTHLEQWEYLSNGLSVLFAIGRNHQGACAIDVAIDPEGSVCLST